MSRHIPSLMTGLGLVFGVPALAEPVEQDTDLESSDQDPADEARDQRLYDLGARLDALEDRVSEDELQRLIDRAEVYTVMPPDEGRPEDRVFLSGARALQKANPEISVSGDLLAQFAVDQALREGRPEGSEIGLRMLAFHVQSVLDPYSLTKMSFDFGPDGEGGVETTLEELYVTWFGLIPSTSVTVGRFRQQLGVLNRWHDHDLDQTYYPAAVNLLLGEGGVVGDGVSIKWFMPPVWAHAVELTAEVVDGNNPVLYSGERFSVPAGSGRLKSYWDLSESTYLELGLSGAFGLNNAPFLATGLPADDVFARTVFGGADLTLYWSPPQRARYRSFTWRSEFLFLTKEDALRDWDRGWGAYSYVQYQLGAKWFVGVRGDLVSPIEPMAEDLVWAAVPYATFWQSEFVYLRGEYQYTVGMEEEPDHRFLVQVDWAAGPHKHEKY